MAEVTLDVIEEVTRRPIAHFEQLEGGICKPTYLVHPRDTAPFVVQYVPPGQLKALEHELLVITMLEDKTELPVPKVLETGLRSGLMPGEFVTKEYINGQNLGDAGESLSARRPLLSIPRLEQCFLRSTKSVLSLTLVEDWHIKTVRSGPNPGRESTPAIQLVSMSYSVD